MNEPSLTGMLVPLVKQLQQCPSPEPRCCEQQLIAGWNTCKRIALEQGDEVTPAVLAGVILQDPETFAPLLNAAEHARLQALGKVALERYLQQIHPPNHLGKTIAEAIKETT